MNRRNFLKLSLVTVAGITVPLLQISSIDIGESNEILVFKLDTSKGDLFFKVPSLKEYEQGTLTWSSIRDISFEAKGDIIVNGMYVKSPVIDYDEWIKFNSVRSNIKILPGDILKISFNGLTIKMT